MGGQDVDGINDNGQYLVDVCAERGLFLGNSFFQHKLIHRYTWARGNERSLVDYIAADNRLKQDVVDARVAGGLFNLWSVQKMSKHMTWCFLGVLL